MYLKFTKEGHYFFLDVYYKYNILKKAGNDNVL